MEYNLVFLGNIEKKKILDNASKIDLPSPAYQFVFLTNKTTDDKTSTLSRINYKTMVFNEGASDDEMLETFFQTEPAQTTIVFRETAKEINFTDVNRMIKLHSQGSKLIVSKQRKNSSIYAKILHPIKNFFTKIFIGVKLFSGEGDIVLLDKILVATLPEMPGKSSSLTKTNSWVGIDPTYITIDNQPKKEVKKFQVKFFAPIIALGLLLVSMIVGNILFAVLRVNMPFLGMFGYIIAEIAVAGLLAFYLTRILFSINYGHITYTSSAEVKEVINNFDE